MKKVIALSIGLAFSVGALAQEQVQSVSTMEKTQSIVKNIVDLAKNNTANNTIITTSTTPTPVSAVAELKLPEPAKVEIKKEEAKPVEKVEVKSEVKVEPKKEDAKTAPVKAETKPELKKEEPKAVLSKLEVKPEVRKEEVKPEVKKEEPKVAKKHVVKHKVKKVVKAKKIVETQVVVPTEPKAVLLQADSYYVPKEASMEQYNLFAKPISYDDVEVTLTSKDESINLSLVDKRINKPLDKFYLANSTLKLLNLTTDLSNKEALEVNYDEANSYTLNFKNKDECRAVFLEYKLNNQTDVKSIVKFVENGNLVNNLPSSCFANISDSKDTTFYTDSGTIINISFSQKQTVAKGLTMQIHFTKDGHEFTPTNLKGYAVSTSFSKFYSLDMKSNPKGPYFGVESSQKVEAGSYYVLIGHEQGQKFEWVKANIAVQ
jgi:hypothetical protein